MNEFAEAKELGSIINLSCTSEQLEELEGYLNSLKSSSMNQDMISDTEIDEIKELLSSLIRQAKLLVQKYDVVITNPPYMPPFSIQKKYVQKNYPDSKSDLFAIFIEKCHELTKKNAYQAMITMHSWMFLSSFEKLRKKLLKDNTIVNMAHLGARAFEDIGGEVVQTTAFIFSNVNIKNYQSNFKRLVDFNSQDAKKVECLKDTNLYISLATDFNKIPGSPIAYWVGNSILKAFEIGKTLDNYANCCTGMQTGNNEKYVRNWFEISSYDFEPMSEKSKKKWVKYNCGGDSRKWYGNHWRVINWENDGLAVRNEKGSVIRNEENFFNEGISWKRIGSSDFYLRYLPKGFIFDQAGDSMFFTDKTMLKYVLGFVNTKVALSVFQFIAPTLNLTAGNMNKLPIIYDGKLGKIEKLVDQNIKMEKIDWDSFETSWDFKKHPLVAYSTNKISMAFEMWSKECVERFNQLKANEEELNRIFIDIYGLQDELTPEVEDKDVTISKADLVRDVKSFISYAVGCMFGRYSLDIEGLAYAGGEWDTNKYKTFIPDSDDIIPICDEDYFEDDIVSRFVEFVRSVYGDDTLEENLQFISDALGGNGNPRDVLRDYFINDFFKDHCKIYQKRPIYWLFDSGKKNGFKALVYIHRYTLDLIARMRTGYIHPLQSQYRTQIEMLNNQIEETSLTSEKVKLKKQLKKITEQSEEFGKYEEKIHHWADKMESMDLDDGVKANYAKFQELLAKIK